MKTFELTNEAIDLAALTDALKRAAICNSCHPGIAVVALLRGAADILCASFGPAETCQLIKQVTDEAMALNGGANAPAGHA
jgi:hypothetical protein